MENKSNKVLVIIDTNKIRQNLEWTKDFSNLIFKGDTLKLIEYIEKNNLNEVLNIGFPEIVVKEFIVSQKENFENIIKRIKNDFDSIKNFDFVSNEFQINNENFNYEEYLQQLFQNLFNEKKFLLSMQTAYDISTYERIVERAINKKKPFTKDGDKGFKDALIWESILNSNFNSDYLKIILYTEDISGFSEELINEFKDKTNLDLEIISSYVLLEQEIYSLLHYYVDFYDLIKFQQTKYYQDKLKEIIIDSTNEKLINFEVTNYGAGIEKFEEKYDLELFNISKEEYLDNEEEFKNYYILNSEIKFNSKKYLIRLLYDNVSNEILNSDKFEIDEKGELI